MVAFEFTVDEAFVSEMFARYRRTQASYIRPALRILVSVFFLGIMIPAFVVTNEPWMPAVLPIVGVILFPNHLTRWLMLHRFRKSPFYNEPARTEIDDDGLRVKTPATESRSAGTTCTEAREFKDGLLLLHGPGMFRWLPFQRIALGTQSEAMAITRSKVARYRVVETK